MHVLPLSFSLSLSLLFSSLPLFVHSDTGTSGSGKITPHDYVGTPASVLATNPPACGTPYAYLDITRITAVGQMNKTTECGTCLKVSGMNDTSKFIYVLAIDWCVQNLDVSIPAYTDLFGQGTDPEEAQWEPTAFENCADIVTSPITPPLPGMLIGGDDGVAGAEASGVISPPPASNLDAMVPSLSAGPAPMSPNMGNETIATAFGPVIAQGIASAMVVGKTASVNSAAISVDFQKSEMVGLVIIIITVVITHVLI